MRFIGDIHGCTNIWLMLTHFVEKSVQVGDMGAGFIEIPELDVNHRFIRGNHDSPEICKEHPNWIPDGHFENGMFFLGGAFSIDWQMRMPGVSWWEDEELSILELNLMIDRVEELKPSIMVTHDCPTKFARLLKSHHMNDKSRTRAALDTILEIHKPDIWIFGHHHVEKNIIVDGVEIIALGEFSAIDI